MDALAIPSLTPQLEEVILEMPTVPPPEGVTANFVDAPDNLHALVYSSIAVCLGLSTLVIGMRMYTKMCVVRRLALEDYTLIAAWVFFIAFCTPCLVVGPQGGVHMWDTHVKTLIELLHVANTVEILYNPTIILLKTTILLQYLRIFAPMRCLNPAMFWGSHLVLWLNVTFYLISMFIQIFSCYPREKAWNILLQGRCFDINKILLSSAIFNCASDIVILILPQYSIWRLQQMGQRQKLWVSVVFGLGIVACLVSAFRIQSVVQLLRTLDFSWYMVPTALWGVAEITLGIICSCLPIMPLFYKKVTGTLPEQRYGRMLSPCTGKSSKSNNTLATWQDKPETPLGSNSPTTPMSSIKSPWFDRETLNEKPLPMLPSKPITAVAWRRPSGEDDDNYITMMLEVDIHEDWRRSAGCQVSMV